MSTPLHQAGGVPSNAHVPLHQSERVKTVAGYALQQRLGSGSFATVYKGVKVSQEIEGADTVAIKAITRRSEKLTQKVLDNLELEISILRTYRHPNIVCLHNVQKTERHFYLILEYCGGGDVQRLIRTRANGRLSERLTRRLMRDLAGGLQFLWGQELIHRDIKPQNLLLTGPLPLDELYDPAKMDSHEEFRRQANYPSADFKLKIADFGFARHLQTTSLAETLCGSPLYMAPEILQHQRYDAKADLWSVGTVLFEMISGRPPFNGENHIDLLRNIQRKAVRLPPDVKVSKECVQLLRILLNRNPLSRAGFKEFLEACDAFVALGCEGTVSTTEETASNQPSMKMMDLGTIHEVDNDNHGAASMMTTETTAQEAARKQPPPPPVTNRSDPITITKPVPGFVTPPFGPITTPSAPFTGVPADLSIPNRGNTSRGYHPFSPLEPSPPQEETHFSYSKNPSLPFVDSLSLKGSSQSRQFRPRAPSQQNDSNSSEESEFVMVDYTSPAASGTELVASGGGQKARDGRVKLKISPPASPRHFQQGSVLSARGDYLLVNERRQAPTKGMLSTSPGTGGALMGMMGGSRGRLLKQSNTLSNFDCRIDSAAKMIATAEDVGRRAISVAHLGDARAYMAMRLVHEEGAVLLTGGPMEGVEEETYDDGAHVTDCEDASATSKETAPATTRQRSFSTTDRSMASVKEGDDDNEEMPFAVPTEAPPSPVANIPSRVDVSSMYTSRRSKLNDTAPMVKLNPEAIRSHLGEALSCYLKALSMLKGVVNAVQKVRMDIDDTPASLTHEQRNRIKSISKRCDVTSKWLTGQFTGVLERADAANVEISKLAAPTAQATAVPLVSVRELIFNHSLACGRDGAVKQLLGQYDASRSCYRSAGLLAETLLMEPSIGIEDRKVLEGYVDGFAARITELDGLMQQQSRTSSATNSGNVSRRGSGSSGVIGLIGGALPFEPQLRVSSTPI
jgi:serine/threonine-protein kinase ULK/ATG1